MPPTARLKVSSIATKLGWSVCNGIPKKPTLTPKIGGKYLRHWWPRRCPRSSLATGVARSAGDYAVAPYTTLFQRLVACAGPAFADLGWDHDHDVDHT